MTWKEAVFNSFLENKSLLTRHLKWLFDDFSGDGSRGDLLEIDVFLEVFHCFFCIECFAAIDVNTDGVILGKCVDSDMAFVDYLDTCDAGVFGYSLHYMWPVKDVHVYSRW